MVETELGEWRRSHYSKELDPSLAESDVTIMGWISSVRSHGNITFLTIVDKMGEVQIVAKKGSSPDDLIENLSKLKEHTSIISLLAPFTNHELINKLANNNISSFIKKQIIH